MNKYYTDPDRYFAKVSKDNPFDALIVTGYPYYKDSMCFVVKDRVEWAAYLYKMGVVKNIIVSGSAVYTPYVEAKIMAMYAHQLGIPNEHIIIESKAEHSVENLYYGYQIAEKMGFKRVAIGSDPSQSSFIKSINDKRFKINVDYLPIIYDTLKTLDRVNPDINEEEAFVKDFVSIVDRQSFTTRLWGTRGRKVKRMMKADKKALKQEGKRNTL